MDKNCPVHSKYNCLGLAGYFNQISKYCSTPFKNQSWFGCDEVQLDVEEDDDDLDALIEEPSFWEENFDIENFHNLNNGESNGEMQKILKLLCEAKRKLYPGSKFTLLSFILRLMRVKTTYRWSNKSFSVLLEILKVALPECNLLPIKLV